jgi:VanZ family protein
MEIAMKDWFWRWGPAVLVMILIFIASATPSSDLPAFGLWDVIVKKGGHMFGYALLAAAFIHGLNNRANMRRSQFIFAMCLAIAYAASDEWHQRFTPGRTSSVLDVFIDSTGAFLGLTLWCFARSRFPSWQKAKGAGE